MTDSISLTLRKLSLLAKLLYGLTTSPVSTCDGNDTTTPPVVESYHSEIKIQAPQVKKRPPDYAKLACFFLHAPADVVKKTFQATTQFAKHVINKVGPHIHKTYKSPNPASNVPRRNEKVATDLIYANCPAIDDGSLKAWLFVGHKTLVADVYGVKKDKHFIRCLWDNIRARGAMLTLLSDHASTIICQKTKDVLRYLCIDGWTSEPHFQHQNPAERRYKTIKHNVQHVMNRYLIPAYAWLLVLSYVCFVMNRTACESLGWKTPMELLTGQTPDISMIYRYELWEDVYFSMYEDSTTLGEDDEYCGWFAGFSENVGNSMTYKILCKETMTVIHRSVLRKASDGRNARADLRAQLSLQERGLDLRGLPLQGEAKDDKDVPIPIPVGTYIPTEPFRLSSVVDDKFMPMADFDPTDLIGRTYLCEPDEDGNVHRAKIQELLDDHQRGLSANPDFIKFRCSVNDGEYEEIVTYNQICRRIEEDESKRYSKDGEKIWTYKKIIGHQGPLTSKDKDYKGSKWNLQLQWEDGSISFVPVKDMLKDDPAPAAKYAQDNGLLELDGWKKFKTHAKNSEKLIRAINQSKLRSFRTAKRYKYGYEVPRDHGDAMRLDIESGNTRWKTAEDIELAQIDEYETFDDKGPDGKPPDGYKKIRVHMVYDVKHDRRHKARLVADGHLTAVPVESVYSSVVSLRCVRIVTFIAELNKLELWSTDIGNAYLESKTNEKVYIIAGPEFGDRQGHLMIIIKALYGLRSSGARWHDRFHDVLLSMGFKPCKLEPDAWMRDKGDHYEYIATYVDDLLIASKDPKAITDTLQGPKYNLKLKGTGPVTFHLGCDYI